MVKLMQLAMVRMVSVVRSPSHAPSPAHTETCALPSRRWRDAVFEVPFRPSSRTEQVCGAKHDGVMRVSPSLEPELTIHLLYPFLVCRLPRAQGAPVYDLFRRFLNRSRPLPFGEPHLLVPSVRPLELAGAIHLDDKWIGLMRFPAIPIPPRLGGFCLCPLIHR